MIQITPDEVLKARGAMGKFDDLEFVYSKTDGMIVVVAQKSGVNVCWACGDPFFDLHPERQMVERKEGGTRIGLHAMCIDPKARKPFFDVARSLEIRRRMAGIARRSSSIGK